MGNKEKCLIIAGGILQNADIIKQKIQNINYDYIIACDKGYDNAVSLGLCPDILIGDLDSVSGKFPRNLEIIKLIPEKDDTDLKVSLKFAYENDYKEIYILCATGGRIDHLLCNLSLLEYAKSIKIHCAIIDEFNEISLLENEKMEYQNTSKYVSIIPITDKILCSLQNMKYPLEKAFVYRDNIISVSNEAASDQFAIEILEGKALVIKADNA